MKRLALAVTLAMALTANATQPVPPQQTFNMNPMGAGGAGGGGGDIRYPFIVPTTAAAIPSNVNQQIICPAFVQGTEAHANWIASSSKAKVEQGYLVPFCVAYHMGNMKLADAIACRTSEAYRKAKQDIADGDKNLACPVEQE